MRFVVLSLFPQIIETVLKESVIGKAREKGLLSVETLQIRDFATDRHRSVDDTPYGGGEGMVMRADVLYRAWEHARSLVLASPVTRFEVDDVSLPSGVPEVRTVYLSPQGRKLDAALAKKLAEQSNLILICGHYEGVDERFIETVVDEEVSIGDYVLTGGELPACVLVDAVARWIPGVVGNANSVSNDSFEGGLLKYPQYTRPAEFAGQGIPEVLLGGNHAKIKAWREQESQGRTRQKRPDLWDIFLSISGKKSAKDKK